ncbi:MAG: helix-turn-helix domain-containing protein [Ruminococcaceae bacterium]|nr:helix-turn-helix domain-containing protein [Oscillospiraceae bacterium]
MKIFCQVEEQARTMLPLYLRTAGNGHAQAPVCRPKGGTFHQFLCIEQGSGLFETPTDSVRLYEGTVVFTRKDVPIAYRQDGDRFQTGWISFDGMFADSLLDYLHIPPFAHVSDKSIRPLMERLCRLAARNESPERLSAAVYDLIITFFEVLRADTQTPALLCAKAYIEQNFARDLAVEEIAAAVGISESLLFRLFRSEEHTTPVEYIRRIRIRHAAQLLSHIPAIPISQIATRCGFWDTSYFCRVFRKQTGMTPGTYRSQHLPI